jgi:hypothetical protein
MNTYWLKPTCTKVRDGGNLIAGPLQINWYNAGLRVHITWPIHKTITLR